MSQLFSAAKRASNFRELKTYYFHNCIYGKVYETENFRDPVPVRDVLHHCTREWKLVMVGDAAMTRRSSWAAATGMPTATRSAARRCTA